MAAPRAGAQALYVADYGNGNVDVVPPAGGPPAVLSTAFYAPFGIAVDSAGNVYVADVSGTTVDEITPGGVVSTFACGIPNPVVVGGGGPTGLAFDSKGNLYISAFGAGEVDVVGPGGGAVSTFATGFYRPEGLAFDSQGNLYVANHGLPEPFSPPGPRPTRSRPAGSSRPLPPASTCPTGSRSTPRATSTSPARARAR
jgi:sugar lactone lactonase YvrE